MLLRAVIAVIGALFFCVPSAPAWLLDDAPVLKEINPEVVYYVGFDDGTGDADLSVGDYKAAVNGQPIFEPGVSGQAFRGAEFRYAVEKNFQVDRPGSLSLWIRPHQWVWGEEEPLLPFFLTDYKGDGYLGLERQGQIVKDGKLIRAGGLLLWFHYFKDIPNQSSMCAGDWKDGEWHFVVITWRGPRWELWVDGQSQFVVNLPRALKQEELSKQFIVSGSSVLIDEFTIYRRPLTWEEIRRIYEVGRRSASS
jgi:hypothetical protein